MKTRFIHLSETDSTNRFLHDFHDDTKADMVVVTTDFQTAGRGQGTHSWESERAKNLLFSVLIHPVNVAVADQFILSEVGALALKKTLDAYTDGITLKWPNDIYWQDRKISGTLIETSVSSHGFRRCIFGVGLNVNQQVFCSDAPNPVALCQIIGHEVDRETLLHAIINHLQDYLQRLYDGEQEPFRKAYHEALYHRQGFWPYKDDKEAFRAEIIGVTHDGHLHLRDDTGKDRLCAFGEVKSLHLQ